MEVQFESPEQLKAFQQMQASHPEAVERLLGQGAKLQDRVAKVEFAFRENYGNATAMHLALLGIFGDPDQSGEGGS